MYVHGKGAHDEIRLHESTKGLVYSTFFLADYKTIVLKNHCGRKYLHLLSAQDDRGNDENNKDYQKTYNHRTHHAAATLLPALNAFRSFKTS